MQATVTRSRQTLPPPVFLIVIQEEGQLGPGPGERSQGRQGWFLGFKLPGMTIGGLLQKIDMPGLQDFIPAVVLLEVADEPAAFYHGADNGYSVEAVHGSFPTHDRHSVWYSQVTH